MVKIRVVFLLGLLLTGAGLAQCQILEDAQVAFQKAEETGKPVMLVFSGSDWCAPCIRFQKNVLSQSSFLDYASDHVVLLKADFPQRKKQPEALRLQNESLAERFNPGGQFPHVLLLKPDQSVLAVLQFKNQKSEEFISQLSSHFAE